MSGSRLNCLFRFNLSAAAQVSVSVAGAIVTSTWYHIVATKYGRIEPIVSSNLKTLLRP